MTVVSLDSFVRGEFYPGSLFLTVKRPDGKRFVAMPKSTRASVPVYSNLKLTRLGPQQSTRGSFRLEDWDFRSEASWNALKREGQHTEDPVPAEGCFALAGDYELQGWLGIAPQFLCFNLADNGPQAFWEGALRSQVLTIRLDEKAAVSQVRSKLTGRYNRRARGE